MNDKVLELLAALGVNPTPEAILLVDVYGRRQWADGYDEGAAVS